MDQCDDIRPFYNPKTKKCLTDSEVNRARRDLIDTRKKGKRYKKEATHKLYFNPEIQQWVVKNVKPQKKTIICPPSKPLFNPKQTDV